MNDLKWELLVEANGRLEAEMLKSYLEAYEIPVELFQESVGKYIYPATIDALGVVQVFVPKEKSKAAHALLEEFRKPSE